MRNARASVQSVVDDVGDAVGEQARSLASIGCCTPCDPERGRIASRGIVQHARDPGAGRAAEDRRQHDRAVMPALEDLGRDRAHDRGQAVGIATGT